ncbi:MAG: hypothetical protein QGG73_07000 [Candidatus Hydrogenedentes bacterium]|jgi:hypothetical protein|nr:hypothetical protein [Candidatus Hydrogenedentota bacterium]
MPKRATSEMTAEGYLARHFDTVVFGAEIDSKLAAKVVTKWAGRCAKKDYAEAVKLYR